MDAIITVGIAWSIKERFLLWRFTRKVTDRYIDRNYASMKNLVKSINSDKHIIERIEVFGRRSVFRNTMRMDRWQAMHDKDFCRPVVATITTTC